MVAPRRVGADSQTEQGSTMDERPAAGEIVTKTFDR